MAAAFNTLTDSLGHALDETASLDGMIGLLFAEEAGNDPRLLLAWQALSLPAAEQPEMRTALLSSLERFLGVLTATLARLAPGADAARVRAVAQGISSSFVMLDSLSPLSPPPGWRQELQQAALLLARTLEAAPAEAKA